MVDNVMLKWARKYRGLSQQQVADAVGLSHQMISKLELDHEPWNSLSIETKAKFNEFFKGSKGWEPLSLEPIKTDEEEKVKKVAKAKTKPKTKKPVTKVEKKDSNLTDSDIKALTLIEFAYEGLSESETHADFIANINMLKKILKKFDF